MMYNAACPGCNSRHTVAGLDSKGWIDVVRCPKCPPVFVLQGVAVARAETALKPLTDQERWAKRERYQEKKKKGARTK